MPLIMPYEHKYINTPPVFSPSFLACLSVIIFFYSESQVYLTWDSEAEGCKSIEFSKSFKLSGTIVTSFSVSISACLSLSLSLYIYIYIYITWWCLWTWLYTFIREWKIFFKKDQFVWLILFLYWWCWKWDFVYTDVRLSLCAFKC